MNQLFRRPVVSGVAAFVLFGGLIFLTGCTAQTAEGATPYDPPATTPTEDDWHNYVDAPSIDAKNAAQFNPSLDTPEGAVVRFLASRVRGDGEWRSSMAPDLSDRAQRAVDEWNEWQLNRFQLRARKDTDANRVWIRAFFEISVGGSSDEGEDEFDVIRDGDGWRIERPPA